ncbi:MAG: endo-1,4-beta-xylanase, partial [Oscillospiraceae bacterium]|nr:endo-1,4-beta-xylanase [Oscillospiraceae bacterium]
RGGWTELKGKYRYNDLSSGYITVYIENDTPDAEYYIDDITITEVVGSELKPELNLPSLAEVYEDYFEIGCCFSAVDLKGARFDLLTHHFNVLTPENTLKPEGVRTADKGFDFSGVDRMLDAAEGAGITAFHGHTLMWHNQTPTWMYKNEDGSPITRVEAEESLSEHISEVAGHFAGRVGSWDVVNEAINDDCNPDSWTQSLRRSEWFKAFNNTSVAGQGGHDIVGFAFRQAREADPGATLYYNDFNLDNFRKARTVAAMVKEVNDAYLAEGNSRLLIEGVGMQGHYNTSTEADAVEKSIRLFGELGLRVIISELDITTGGGEELAEADEAKQAAKYAELFQVFRRNSDVIERVTLWGLDDRSSWRASNYPLLFNSDLTAKQAFFAVLDPDGFLANYDPASGADVGGLVLYGTPEVDGKIDDVWSTAEVFPITTMLQAWDTASGTAKALWDEEYLYVLFEVSDPILDDTSAVVHEKDSVEAFVDEDNCKAGGYQPGDGQYRVDINNFVSTNDSTDLSGFGSAVEKTESGYTVEMKIPWKIVTPEIGMIIGFDAQINDAEDGARIGIAKWNDPTDESWRDTSGWGEVMLVGASGEVPSDSSGLPVWAVAAAVAGAIIIAGAVTVLIIKKKRATK